MDALTYAGNMANLADVFDHERLRFIKGDIRNVGDVARALDGIDVIVNAAAESHVSKSIEFGGGEFVTTNVEGTQVLLDAMRDRPIERFILISSSEVYGTAESEPMAEDHPLNPRSPYAGTKAGGDRLAYSYWCTYDLPIVIIRPFNNYGPYQHPEKVIPRFIIQALTDQPLTIHGNGVASRDWLHVFDTAEAITAACEVPTRAGHRPDHQRRHRGGRVGRVHRRRGARPSGQAREPQELRPRPARPGRPSHRLHRPGGRSSWAGDPASHSRRDSKRRSPGTATTRSGGGRCSHKSKPPSRRERPPLAHAGGAGRRTCPAARDRRRARNGRAHDRVRQRPAGRRRARLDRGHRRRA